MLNAIKTFFDSKLADGAENVEDLKHRTNLASAALLIEVMNSDYELDERESEEFTKVLRESLAVSEEEVDELTELARSEAHEATSLYEFTRLINDNFDYGKKCELIENMWRIAFSDQQLDKYEEHLIRRVSELIYVSHSDFIRTKLMVRDA